MLFAHDATAGLLEPALQYGAFGLCVMLSTLLGLAMKSQSAQSKLVLQVLRETSHVIALNTTTIETVSDSVARHDAAAVQRGDKIESKLEILHNKLLTRKCIALGEQGS